MYGIYFTGYHVNSKKQDNTELGRLMHDLHCKEADSMYSSILSARVRELKETVLSLFKMQMPIKQIAKAVNIEISTVQSWIDENKQ